MWSHDIALSRFLNTSWVLNRCKMFHKVTVSFTRKQWLKQWGFFRFGRAWLVLSAAFVISLLQKWWLINHSIREMDPLLDKCLKHSHYIPKIFISLRRDIEPSFLTWCQECGHGSVLCREACSCLTFATTVVVSCGIRKWLTPILSGSKNSYLKQQ